MNKKWQLGILVGAMAWGSAHAGDLLGIKDLPDIKEGLWESSTMMPGAMNKPMHTTMCNSNAVSKKMYEDTHRTANARCKEIHSERNGSVITTETECNFNGKATRSKSVTTLTGNTGIHLEMRKADNTVESVIDMKWVGACPVGMKLGDVTGPDGKVMFNAMTP
jgi:Protein of unknown function (DUF3617)